MIIHADLSGETAMAIVLLTVYASSKKVKKNKDKIE